MRAVVAVYLVEVVYGPGLSLPCKLLAGVYALSS